MDEQQLVSSMDFSEAELVDVSRSHLYSLLALGFGFPGEEAEESQGELWELAEALYPDLGLDKKPVALTAPHIESLYINVLDGHDRHRACRPYESAWSGSEDPKHRWEVKAFYQFFGLNVEQEKNEFPDHIVHQLEFMHFLAARGVEAGREESEDPNGRGHYLRAQKDFLERHLQWVPAFCEALEKKTDEPFYVQLARVTARFVQDDLDWVREEIQEA